MNPSAKRWLALGIALLALGLVSLFFLRRSPVTPRAEVAVASIKRIPQTPPSRPAPIAPLPPVPVPTAPAPTEDRLRRVLEDYEKEAIYPPTSRPHGLGTEYKLRWNEPFVDDHPLEEDGTEDTGDTHYRFGADRAHAGVDEALTSWMEVWTGTQEQRIPARLSAAFVESTETLEGVRLVPLVYNDEGKDGDAVAGDLRYTNRFVPSREKALASLRDVRLAMDVEAGGKHRRVTRSFTYAPRHILRVDGLRDTVVEGSLQVSVDVEVLEPGLYDVEANLLSVATLQPVSYAKTSVTLPRGRGTVPLRFFGRAFHERGLDGPYRVQDLRGFKRPEDGGLPLWWSDARTYDTRAYRKEDFSSAPWDSPEKQSRIDTLNRLRDEAASGRGVKNDAPRHIHIDDKGVEHIDPSPPQP